MKTHHFRLLVICSVLLFFSFDALAQPNCNYEVNNPGGCSIVVEVEMYDNTTALCYSSGPTTISSASNLIFPCGSCAQPLSNVVVKLTSIGGWAPAGSPIVDINTLNENGTVGAPCSSGNWTMDWDPDRTNIGY